MDMTGGCQCGAIRYRLAVAPAQAAICHCRMCQKAVGQPFAAYATVQQADFAWTRGSPPAFRASSAAERHFCPHCGTPLTFRYFAKTTISVTLGSLDHPGQVPPTVQLGIESRLPWTTDGTLATLPGQTTGGDSLPPYLRDLTIFQHPDHDTPEGWVPPH